MVIPDALNRTLLELKRLHRPHQGIPQRPLNRTLLELKHTDYIFDPDRFSSQSNLIGIETYPIHILRPGAGALNRTLLELKRENSPVTGVSPNSQSYLIGIETRERDGADGRGDLSIVPYWN